MNTNSSSPRIPEPPFQAAFFRSYRFEFNLQKSFRPAELILSVKGPVDPQSGMVLNLVEFDRSSRGIVETIEQTSVASRDEAVQRLFALWSRASGEWGLVVPHVEIREAHDRSWRSLMDGVLFSVRAPLRFGQKQRLGDLELVFSQEAARNPLREWLRQMQGGGHTKIEGPDLFKARPELVGAHFQEWKSRQKWSWSYSSLVLQDQPQAV